MRSTWLSSWETALRDEHGVIGRVLEGITYVHSQLYLLCYD
jgi:hypothetical protein